MVKTLKLIHYLCEKRRPKKTHCNAPWTQGLDNVPFLILWLLLVRSALKKLYVENNIFSHKFKITKPIFYYWKHNRLAKLWHKNL